MVLCWIPSLYKFNIEWVGRYPSLTPVDQLRMKLGMKSYSSWYYTSSEFVVLAKKNRFALNMHLKLLNIIKVFNEFK